MAGGPGLFGMPLSTGSAVTPTDYSPWMRALDRIQRQHNQQQQFGLRQQQLGEQSRRFDVSRGDEQERFQLEFGRAQELEERRRKERRQDITREQEGIEAERDWRGQLRQDTLDQREYQRQQDERERARAEEEAEAQERKQRGMTGLQNRMRRLLPVKADEIRADMGPDAALEDIRDQLIAKADHPKLTPEERKLILDEIDQWYNTEAKLEQERMKREERRETAAEKKRRREEEEAAEVVEEAEQRRNQATLQYHRDPFVRANLPRVQKMAEDIAERQATIKGLEQQLAGSPNNKYIKDAIAAQRAGVEELEAQHERLIQRLNTLWREYMGESPPQEEAGQESERATAPRQYTAQGIQGLQARVPAQADRLQRMMNAMGDESRPAGRKLPGSRTPALAM